MSLVAVVESLSTAEGRLLRLEVVVLLSALILALLVLSGAARRPRGDRLLRGAVWTAYALSYVVVSYAVGLIQDSPLFRDEAFVVWASALLVIQVSAYSTSAHSRRDVVQRKKLLLQHVLQSALVLWLALSARGRNLSYRVAAWTFWGLNVLKTVAKIVDVVKTSRSDWSLEDVKVVVDYMAVEHELTAHQPFDPKTMRGYRYLFHGEDRRFGVAQKGEAVVTIDQVWRWIDEQGYSEAEKDKVKDFCLAFALFKLLKRRFFGYVPAEARLPKTRELVLSGLLHPEATGPHPAFRVVEVELTFLYEFFYTRNVVPVGAEIYITIVLSILGISIWTAAFGTFGPGYHHPVARVISAVDFDRAVTVVVIAMTVVLELSQALVGFSSNWRYVESIYRNVRNETRGVKWLRVRPRWWKNRIAPPKSRYWEDKIGEYVLLSHFNHHPWNVLPWLTLFLVEPSREGQKRVKRAQLPSEVKSAVLNALKSSNGYLTNGRSAIARNGLAGELSWACGFATHTDMILVWHIATTLCDWDTTVASPQQPSQDRQVANKLSCYCAYLVAFVPEMLPDQSYKAEQTFDTAVLQAREILKGCRTKKRICERMDGLQHGNSVVEMGAKLGRQVRAIGDKELQWKVLAEFWAEFILYLAPSDNVDIHAEMLGAGGEFMTQLWVLLTHAGILERPPSPYSREDTF